MNAQINKFELATTCTVNDAKRYIVGILKAKTSKSKVPHKNYKLKYAESATEAADFFDEKSYDKSAEQEEEEESDTEEPAPRQQKNLADYIIKKR
uniref:Alba domain-containing protein n=1 Tax=Panagrellus redivivus TaxID=6233 RepID=A0A7E4VI96_PANRE